MSLSNVIKAVIPLHAERPIEHKAIKTNSSIQLDFPPELHELARQITEEAERKADMIRQQVNQEAEAFKEEVSRSKLTLEREREHVLEEAKKKGGQQGFEEGKREALNTYQDKLIEAQKIIKSAEIDYHKYLEQAEKEILNLALTTCEAIIGTELEQNPDNWIALVKKVVRQVRDQEPIKLILNPKWYDHVIDHREEVESITHHHRVLIIPDDSLTEDDCLIETPFGRIEAGIDNQLKMIRTKLFEMLEDPDDEEGLSAHK